MEEKAAQELLGTQFHDLGRAPSAVVFVAKADNPLADEDEALIGDGGPPCPSALAMPGRRLTQAASALRKLFDYPDNTVPRDVYTDFRSIGIHVFRRRLHNSNISGLFVRHPTAGERHRVGEVRTPHDQTTAIWRSSDRSGIALLPGFLTLSCGQ
jgi:hypothetical protein